MNIRHFAVIGAAGSDTRFSRDYHVRKAPDATAPLRASAQFLKPHQQHHGPSVRLDALLLCQQRHCRLETNWSSNGDLSNGECRVSNFFRRTYKLYREPPLSSLPIAERRKTLDHESAATFRSSRPLSICGPRGSLYFNAIEPATTTTNDLDLFKGAHLGSTTKRLGGDASPYLIQKIVPPLLRKVGRGVPAEPLV